MLCQNTLPIMLAVIRLARMHRSTPGWGRGVMSQVGEGGGVGNHSPSSDLQKQ